MKLPFVFKVNFVGVWKFIRRYILRKRPTPTRNFGLKRDTVDNRDFVFAPKYKLEPPPETTARKNFKDFPFRWDQGSIGSCTGHGGSAGFIKALITNGQPIFEPSRLFAYYNARTDEYKNDDSGASIRDTIKGLNKFGLCKEETWPYDIYKFANKPSDQAFAEGEQHQALSYYRIFPVTKEAIMSAIYEGYAVVYGQILYESFMSAEVATTGIVPYPKKCKENEVGGHCKCILDYEPAGVFELNSWNKSWGIDGGCLIPWKYVLDNNKSFDFWVIKITE